MRPSLSAAGSRRILDVAVAEAEAMSVPVTVVVAATSPVATASARSAIRLRTSSTRIAPSGEWPSTGTIRLRQSIS
jgi:hypothetical protein